MQFVLLLFILIPIIEMVVLIEVGSIVGVLNTILLVLLTAVIGVTLLKRQGLATLMEANQKMQRGEMPASEMAQGLMLAVAGALLLTPGFVTDTIGFLLLTPSIRQALATRVFNAMLKNGNIYYQQTEQQYRSRDGHSFTSEQSPKSGASHRRPDEQDVIEGEFQEIKEDTDRLER